MDSIDEARELKEQAVRFDQAGQPHEACRAMLRAFQTLHAVGLDVAALGAMEQAAMYARKTGDRKGVQSAFREIVDRLRARDGDAFARKVQAAMMAGLKRGSAAPPDPTSVA